MFPRDMVCLMNISVDTLHKGDTEDNNNNNNNKLNKKASAGVHTKVLVFSIASSLTYNFTFISTYFE